jgi:hypothetical protein
MDRSPNPFEAPGAARPTTARPSAGSLPFYAVAPWKVNVYMVCTLGLYAIFWFYRHNVRRRAAGRDIVPGARALFHVFFTHSLFQEVNEAEDEAGLAPQSSLAPLATVYVLVVIAESIYNRATANAEFDLTQALVLLLALGIRTTALATVQTRVHRLLTAVAPGYDPNDSIGVGGILVILFGGLFWLLMLVGLAFA